MPKKNYLTPTELINKYPEVSEKMNWSANDIGYMLRLRVLNGYTTKRKTMIDEESFLGIVNWANTITQDRIVKI